MISFAIACSERSTTVMVSARLRGLLIRRFVSACVYAGLVLLAPAASGDVDVWSSIGPTGGNVFALAIDPHAPATIYAGTGGGTQKFSSSGGGSVFKTTNGGASWAGAGRGLTADVVLSLAIDPVTTSTVYAGTRNHGVRKSTDGGTSWTAASSGLTTNRIWVLAIDPGTPSTLYAGTASGVFKSTDGAASWTAASERPRGTAGIRPGDQSRLALDSLCGHEGQRRLQERRRRRDVDGGLERVDPDASLRARDRPQNAFDPLRRDERRRRLQEHGRRGDLEGDRLQGDQLRPGHRSRHADNCLCLRQLGAGREEPRRGHDREQGRSAASRTRPSTPSRSTPRRPRPSTSARQTASSRARTGA